ncbi:MAG TPA: translation elongation factor Ts [Syntrophaceae bacterium]|nr:translation elongation factor Ts [Syntrophaceae bacterium]
MEIKAPMVKELRERTGAGILDCKEALKATEGDVEKAIDYLRRKGLLAAAKRAGRATQEGLVEAYIHIGGKIGVLVEVDCETDFVAKSQDFKDFVRNLAMHIAATNPLCIRREDLPTEVVEKERDIYREQALELGKPEKVIDKIVEGRMGKFYKDVCLLEQPYVRDPEITIQDLVNQMIAKLGENIAIRRFTRYQLGVEA